MLQLSSDPIRAAAEHHEQAVARHIYDAWCQCQLNSAWPTEAVVKQLMLYLQPVATELVGVWRQGAAAFTPHRAAVTPFRKFTAQFLFDRLAPQTDQASQDWAAQFIREVGDDLRVTLASTIQDGVQRGLGPEELALNVRDSIGLTRFQARAVQNYRQALEANSPKSLDYRLRDARFDSMTAQAIDAGAPLSSEQIDARVARYKQRYLSDRALTIARYETLYASNAGAHAAVQGINRPVVKLWLIAPDEAVCPRCRSIVNLQPKGVSRDEPFQWEHGKHSGKISFPPLHPKCRCTATYRVL